YKSPTTPDDPVHGVLNVLTLAAVNRGQDLAEFLAAANTLLHGTTRALNAVLSGKTARTAFLTTEGHPDVLLYREGGRSDPFNFLREYPAPYVPRALTWEVPERIGAAGEIVKELDEARVATIASEIARRDVAAVSVCLLFSPINPIHELRVGELLARYLPKVPVTLSHQLAPLLREYRRASAAAIDASLKPLMTDYIGQLEGRLRHAGFGGRLLVVTSTGGVLDAAAVAKAPILAINSGPSMAPVAGLHHARLCAHSSTAIVADTGGTSYDVSLVRNGHIPRSRETWLGDRFYGHMTGFPSVDITSIGAGGGSIASVDDGGLLCIGPESAGANPGPACYDRGGSRPTVTDACVALGFIDPNYFLGGKMKLSLEMAREAIRRDVAGPLRISVEAAANAILELATEKMVHAIENVTVNHGVDPTNAVLVAGGGAAGLNSIRIASRLAIRKVLFPHTGAVLSAAGALLADLTATYSAPAVTTSAAFNFESVNSCLARLRAECEAFATGPGAGAAATTILYSVEARYERQVWELEIPLPIHHFQDDADVKRVLGEFHKEHRAVFAVADDGADIEMLTWNARVSCRLHPDRESSQEPIPPLADATQRLRVASFGAQQPLEVPVRHIDSLSVGERVAGPAIVESGYTTIVIDPGAIAELVLGGGILVDVPLVGPNGGDANRTANERMSVALHERH
ncbi:MAG: hydantoinase/oxoprolinase family protein, partial [Proteobacteria bacterium]|nr:hydantoinase/oxoprolinase family protein [Pseudomonadota bacterium]